jgi:hypothetical protein
MVQCIAHGIMGSSFMAYGTIMAILLLLGQEWLIRRNKSQEFFDSIVICLWGYYLLSISPLILADWSIPSPNIDGAQIGRTRICNIPPWASSGSVRGFSEHSFRSAKAAHSETSSLPSSSSSLAGQCRDTTSPRNSQRICTGYSDMSSWLLVSLGLSRSLLCCTIIGMLVEIRFELSNISHLSYALHENLIC